MSQELLRVSTKDKKYTVVQDSQGKLTALRYGEEWRDCVGDKLILALAQELRDCKDLLKKCDEFFQKVPLEFREHIAKAIELQREIKEATKE